MDPSQFLNNPALQEMMNDPNIASMLNNPEMMNQLMSNPNIRQMAESFGAGQGFPGMGGMGGSSPSPSSTQSAPAAPKKTVTELTGGLTTLNNLINTAKLTQTPIIIDCYATWCGPCQRFAPTFESYPSIYPDITFIKCNGEKNQDVCQKYNVTAYPTFLLLVNGEIVDTIIGVDKSKIETYLENMSADIKKRAYNQTYGQYTQFPIRENELALFKTIEWSKIKSKLSSVLVSGCDTALYNTTPTNMLPNGTKSTSYTSPEVLLRDILSLCTFLENPRDNSMSDIPMPCWNALDTILSWPGDQLTAPLHILRMLLLHSDGAKQIVNKTALCGTFPTVIHRIIDSLETVDSWMVIIVAARTLSNCFDRYILRNAVVISPYNEATSAFTRSTYCEEMITFATGHILLEPTPAGISAILSLIINISYTLYTALLNTKGTIYYKSIVTQVYQVIEWITGVVPLIDPVFDVSNWYRVLISLGTLCLGLIQVPAIEGTNLNSNALEHVKSSICEYINTSESIYNEQSLINQQCQTTLDELKKLCK